MNFNFKTIANFIRRSSELEKVELPPFIDISRYATGENVLPQQFYLDPAQKTLFDLTLKVKDKVLQVDGAKLKANSRVFKIALSNSAAPQEPIFLEDASVFQVLALLRFIHDENALSQKAIEVLDKAGELPGVVRLAFDLGVVFLLRLCQLAAASETVYDSELQAMLVMSSKMGLDELNHGYLKAVAKQVGTAAQVPKEKAAAEAAKLCDSTGLLKIKGTGCVTGQVSPIGKGAPVSVTFTQNAFVEDEKMHKATDSVASFRIPHFDWMAKNNKSVEGLKFKVQGVAMDLNMSIYSGGTISFHVRMVALPPLERAKIVDFSVRAMSPTNSAIKVDFGPFRHIFFQGGDYGFFRCERGVDQCRKCIGSDGAILLEISSLAISE